MRRPQLENGGRPRPAVPRDGRILNRTIAAALAVLLVLLGLLVLAVNDLLVSSFDMKVALELQEETNPVFAAVMTYVSILGKLLIAIPLTLVTAAALFFTSRKLDALFVLLTGANFPVCSLLKVLVARARPAFDIRDGNGFIQTFEGYSFPSGHVVFFMSFFGMLGYLAWRRLTGLSRWAAVAICALLTVLVGPSRVYLGAHWASDVAGGYLVGAVLLLALVHTYETALRRFAGTGDSA